MLAKGASPEDIMSNALFQARWADVVKTRGDELIALKVSAASNSAIDVYADTDMTSAECDLSGSKGGKNIERCAPDTNEWWDSFAGQLVRQYVRLLVEPKSQTGIASDIKNSALNGDFIGDLNKHTVAVCLDPDLLQEASVRPVDRKPPPNQEIISKLVQGTLCARGGATNTDGLRVAPRDNDILFLVDGCREAVKSALHLP